MAVATQAPPHVGAEIAAEEACESELAPLADVHGLVPAQLLVPGGCRPNGHDRADGDGRGARWDRAADPDPVVAVPRELHRPSPLSVPPAAARSSGAVDGELHWPSPA